MNKAIKFIENELDFVNIYLAKAETVIESCINMCEIFEEDAQPEEIALMEEFWEMTKKIKSRIEDSQQIIENVKKEILKRI